MILQNRSLALLFLVLFTGCASASMHGRKVPTLAEVEKVKIGESRQNIRSLFGQPDREIKYSKDGQDKVVWFYGSKGETICPNTNFSFNEKDGRLERKSYFVSETDSIQNMKDIRTRYPMADFTKVDHPMCHHYGPHLESFVDQKLGLSVSQSIHNQEISQISWQKPNDRMIASIQTCPKERH